MNMTTTYTPEQGWEQPTDRHAETGETWCMFFKAQIICISFAKCNELTSCQCMLCLMCLLCLHQCDVGLMFIYPTCTLSGVALPSPRVILVGKKSTWPWCFWLVLVWSWYQRQLTAALILSSCLRVRLMEFAEAAVIQQEASVTVSSPWHYWLHRPSARVTVRRREVPHYSVTNRPAVRSLRHQTACVSVSISWPWERLRFQSLLPTVSCTLTFS